MTAGIYNFTLDQGGVLYLNLVYQNPNGTPINLTGQTGRMQLRRKFSSVADLTLTTSNGGITITPLTGNVLVTMTDEQTGDLEPGFFLYDFECRFAVRNGTATVVKLLTGTVMHKKERRTSPSNVKIA